MGRLRRRNRREPTDQIEDGGAPSTTVAAPAEVLAPTYVSVGEAAWSAESDTPVLALDGLKPWEEIRGPAILLDDEPAPAESYIPDSNDPRQLDLTAAEVAAALAAGQAAQSRDAASTQQEDETEFVQVDRPILVLEPEPETHVEVQAELPLVMPHAVVIATDDAAPRVETVAAEASPIDHVEQTYQAARAASAEGRIADAKTLYQQALVERPSHVGARNNLALLLESAGNQQGALNEYDRALEFDAENATLLTNRGALLGAMGRYAAAERDLKKVLRVDPSHPEGLFNLGVVMTKKGLWGEAVPQLRRAVELDPTRGAAYFYLGEALNHIDDLYGAMAAYQRASELMPDHPRALYGLGIVYDRLGHPDDAARMYRKSREIGWR